MRGRIVIYTTDEEEAKQLKEDLRFVGTWYAAQGLDVAHPYVAGYPNMSKTFKAMLDEKLAEIEEAEGIKEG